MPLLIDGYNLLHVTGLFGRGAKGSFEASRAALVGFLAAAIDASEREQTTIVFDAAEAPPGLPNLYRVHGITVHYARGYDSADTLLEELIAAHHTPRKLTVVSSDHRVQRAAKKRRASAIDSDVWYRAAGERLQQQRKRPRDLPDIKPDAPLSQGEVEAWLRAFGPIDIPEDEPTTPPATPPVKNKPVARRTKKPLPTKPAPAKRVAADRAAAPPARAKKMAAKRPTPRRRKPRDLGFGDIANPFPPGYGEDITDGS